MKFYSQIMHAALCRVGAAFFAMLFAALTARWLGPEGRGQIATLLALVSGMTVILHFSLAHVAVQRIGAAVKGDAKFRESQIAFGVFVTILTCGTAASCLAMSVAAAAGVLRFTHLSASALWLALILVPFVVWEGYSGILLGALGKLSVDSMAILAGKFIGLSTGAVLLAFGLGVPGAVAAMLMGAAVTSLLTATVVVRELGAPRLPSWRQARQYLHNGLKLQVNAVAQFVSVGLDVVIVAMIAGIGSTGVYQLGAQVVGSLLIIPASIAAVFFSRNAMEGHIEAWRHKRKLVLWSAPAFSILAFCLYHSAPLWIALLFGPQFSQLNNLIGIQLVTFVFLAFSQLMGPQWIARGLFKTLAGISLGLAVLSVVMNLALVPVLGNAGAAIVRLLCVALAALTNVYMFLRCDAEANRTPPSTMGRAGGDVA